MTAQHPNPAELAVDVLFETADPEDKEWRKPDLTAVETEAGLRFVTATEFAANKSPARRSDDSEPDLDPTRAAS